MATTKHSYLHVSARSVVKVGIKFVRYLLVMWMLGGWGTARLAAQSSGASATADYIRWYQHYLSPQKNSRCPMHPHCSAYGMQLYARYSFVSATCQLADRLIRCSHDPARYARTFAPRYGALYDPVPADSTSVRKVCPLPRPYVLEWVQRGEAEDVEVFVNHLINQAQYREALLEIEREQVLGQGLTPPLLADRLLCLRALDEFEKGLLDYAQADSAARVHPAVAYQAALLFYGTTNYDSVGVVLSRVPATEAGAYAERSNVLQGLAEARCGAFGEAANRLVKEVDELNPGVALRNRWLLEQLQKPPTKHPVWAGVLGVVPGAGYWYAGHRGSALTALLVNSLLAYATYTSVRSRNYGVAGLCGFLGLSFYIGNISGSVRSARRYNDRKRIDLWQQIERNNHLYSN